MTVTPPAAVPERGPAGRGQPAGESLTLPTGLISSFPLSPPSVTASVPAGHVRVKGSISFGGVTAMSVSRTPEPPLLLTGKRDVEGGGLALLEDLRAGLPAARRVVISAAGGQGGRARR